MKKKRLYTCTQERGIFMCVPIGWGCCNPFYNPSVSNICTGLNSISAVLNGVTNSINARNRGADPYLATAIGVGTTSVGLSNAFMGNFVDKATGTYFGSATSNIFSTAASLSGNYGFGYTPFMGFGMPIVPMFGMYSMPMFGGFCCYC